MAAFQQKVIYAAAFKLHFGVSEEMASFLDDFLAFFGAPLPEPASLSATKVSVNTTSPNREHQGKYYHHARGIPVMKSGFILDLCAHKKANFEHMFA
ncbi:hypothetical protein OSTOST_15459, partial [Ostertagia ostertagi]